VATLQELETWYSLDDVLDANDALTAWKNAEYEASKPR
jgi:hypothetical protein